MTIKIEKDVKWDQHTQTVKTDYFVLVNGKYVAVLESEEEAHETVKKIKETYVNPSKEVIYEEEFNG